MVKFRFLLVVALLAVSNGLFAETYVYKKADDVISISPQYFEYFLGTTNEKDISTRNFIVADKMDYGLQSEDLWLRINLRNESNEKNVYLMLPIAHLDSILVYDSLSFLDFSSIVSGDLVEAQTKDFIDPYHIFKIELLPDEERSIYIKVTSQSQLLVPFSISDKDSINSHLSVRNIFFGAFIGVLLVMFFYNLIIYVYTRADSYTYYIFYLLSMMTAQSGLTGVSTYILGDWPLVNNSLMFIGSGAAGIFSILFIRSFLDVRAKLPKLNKVLHVLLILYTIVLVTALSGKYEISFVTINISGPLIALTFAIIAITLTVRGDRKAKFYLTAWIGLIISIIFYTLTLSGVYNFVPNSNFIIPIGVVLETILLSLALADSINILREESAIANLRVIKEVQKNEELVRDQNVTLENKVNERTAELQLALDNLREAQTKLVQSEKMASLGTLTAGIAHEINNPINFVSANVLPLRDNIEEISNLLKEYQNIDQNNLEEELKRLAKIEGEIDLPYTLTETKELIDGIEEGARRTHTIVEGLTTFSRGDAGKMIKSDIHKGIRSTISVLKSRLNNIDLIVDKAEDLPKVSCQIGKINQVILNLLNNALDALEEKNGANSILSSIIVKTNKIGGTVQIKIIDNANGMEEDIQRKVMEPFYTTKEVGKGTGLGLSISYSIIEEHGGSLELSSEVGEGTTFTVTLPIES